MKYYLDCEFNSYRGELLSMALIREDVGLSIYAILKPSPEMQVDPWVAAHVLPYMLKQPMNIPAIHTLPEMLPGLIESVLKGDPNPVVISDWPDDHKYFAEAVITGPGRMINIPNLTMHVARVDAYPTKLEGAVQHNAFWDALALLVLMEKIGPQDLPRGLLNR